MKEIQIYVTATGKKPYSEWLSELGTKTRARVYRYVLRVAQGGGRNNVKRLREADGLFEIRIDTGPGYRVYYGEIGGRIILLLGGGDKKTQDRDIEQVKGFWRTIHV